MRKVLTGNITIELLVRFIEGSVNDPIKTEINQWINADPENREFYNRFRETWLDPQGLSALLKENRETDWKIISNAIGDQKHISTTGRSIRMHSRWWLRIAAVLLVSFSTTIGYFVGRDNKQPLSLSKTGYHEIIVPTGEKSELTLSDGTRIWINAGSKIRIPNQFNNESRDIWLDGEAFFEVTHDKIRPFLVHTSELDVRVYGTKFNLKAYNDEDIIEATLVEGLVSIETRNRFNNKKEEVFLQPNHKAVYLKRKNAAIISEIIREVSAPLEVRKIIISKPIKVEPSISWREGKLVFVDESFESISVKLERRYGVIIHIDNEHIKKVKYTGILKNISIEQALKAILLTTNFNYAINDNTVIISEKVSAKNKD